MRKIKPGTTTLISARLPIELYEKASVHADEHGTTLTRMVQDGLWLVMGGYGSPIQPMNTKPQALGTIQISIQYIPTDNS